MWLVVAGLGSALGLTSTALMNVGTMGMRSGLTRVGVGGVVGRYTMGVRAHMCEVLTGVAGALLAGVGVGAFIVGLHRVPRHNLAV
jgi:hypothetical protein